jgi:hypothetical protein
MPKSKPLAVAFLLLALAAGGTFWFKVHQANAFFEPHTLLSRFPAEESSVLSIDVKLLRQAGLLTASTGPLEPDYKQFLDGTGFDYRKDLDSLLASFSNHGNYYIARGRFNWPKLREYVTKQGGSCYQELCRVQGSTPDRHVSFLPLRDDALAMAVSTNDLAVTALARPGQPIATALPSSPVWLSVPGAELRRPNSLPAGIRWMLSALQTVDRITITVGPSPEGIEARLETLCKTPVDADLLTSQLRTTTANLKEALARDKDSRDDELAAMLMAGSFDQNDRKVTGKWPVRKSLIDSLTAGI